MTQRCGASVFAVLLSEPIIFCICNISDVSLDCSWQSTTPHSRLTHCTRRHPGHKMDNTFAAQALEMSGCRLLMGNQCQHGGVVDCSWTPVALYPLKSSIAIVHTQHAFHWRVHMRQRCHWQHRKRFSERCKLKRFWPIRLLGWNQALTNHYTLSLSIISISKYTLFRCVTDHTES